MSLRGVIQPAVAAEILHSSGPLWFGMSLLQRSKSKAWKFLSFKICKICCVTFKL
jgi:hypothetical protein